jgi:hypothetical protein
VARAFCASRLEAYVGRRLLALLAALALADVVILVSIGLSTAVFVSLAGDTTVRDVLRTRALEVVNAQGEPILVATTDDRQGGVLWVSSAGGAGGVSLGTDEGGNGVMLVNAASGAPLLTATARDTTGGALRVLSPEGTDLAFIGSGDRGHGLLMANSRRGVNLFLAGADSAANGGLLINSANGTNLIYAGTGEGGNGGMHVNNRIGVNLLFFGADAQGSGAIGLWDRAGRGRLINARPEQPSAGGERLR